MAKLGNKKTFSGMVGNVVFRNLNGRQIVQSRPSNVKHSETQKRSASEFGNCSRWAKQLRIGLDPLFMGMADNYMYQRFTAAVYNAVKESELPQGGRTPITANMQALEGFEFNSHSPFADYFKPQLTAELNGNNEVAVTTPAFEAGDDIAFPSGCDNAKLVVYVFATDFKDNTIPVAYHAVLAIGKGISVPAQVVLNTSPIPAGYFILAAAKLLYFKHNVVTGMNYLNTKNFSPAAVIMTGAAG